METYRLTTRGKWVLGIFILLLIVGMVYSGKYIAEYFTSTNNDYSVINPDMREPETSTTVETTGTEEAPLEIETEETTEYQEIQTTSEARIYSQVELDDLKQFKITFYFDADSSENVINIDAFDALLAAIKSYPNESIVIEGHANGYPDYKEDLEMMRLSLDRSTFIKDKLMGEGIDLNDLIITYYGGERPAKRNYGEQHLNHRVEVYFGNHFIYDSIGK